MAAVRQELLMNTEHYDSTPHEGIQIVPAAALNVAGKRNIGRTTPVGGMTQNESTVY